MDAITILVLGDSDLDNVQFGIIISAALKMKVIPERYDFKLFQKSGIDVNAKYDIAFIGERVSEAKSIQISRFLRTNNFKMPIICLTKQSEVKLSQAQQSAGIDDFLNIVELNSPTFFWTFSSILKKADISRKAEEFDIINHVFEDLNKKLSSITHETNNALGIIRLAMYQLSKKDLDVEKKEIYFQTVTKHIDKVEEQIKQLRAVRDIIYKEQSTLRKVTLRKISK